MKRIRILATGEEIKAIGEIGLPDITDSTPVSFRSFINDYLQRIGLSHEKKFEMVLNVVLTDSLPASRKIELITHLCANFYNSDHPSMVKASSGYYETDIFPETQAD